MAEYDPQEKELVKRLDLKIIPFLACLYFLMLMDRSNQLHTGIPNLVTEEMLKKHLGIETEYLSVIWSLVAYSVGSLLATLPSTLAFLKFGPKLSFSVILGTWGVAMIVTSLVTNFAWFVAARFCLGVFQAGFVPCIFIYIVSFFTREEYATRFAYVISVASVSQSLSELLSDYASQSQTRSGLSGWQLLYILEGIAGLLLGVVTWFYLPSFPDTCSFLNPADKVLAIARGREGYDKEEYSLTQNTAGSKTKAPLYRFSYVQFLDIIQDARIWLLSVSYLCVTTALDLMIVATPEVSATAFQITKTCIANCTAEQLDLSLGIPFALEIVSILPYGLALVCTYFVAVRSDSSGDRATCASIPLAFSVFGFLILALVPINDPVAYFLGVLPAIVGLISSTPCILAYAMDHASGDTQRATVAAIAIGLGHSLGILMVALEQLVHVSSYISNPAVYWITAAALTISICCVMYVQKRNRAEEQSGWGKAPGLRRLLNDVDESKAWDVELNNVEDFVKTEHVGYNMANLGKGGWESSDDL